MIHPGIEKNNIPIISIQIICFNDGPILEVVCGKLCASSWPQVRYIIQTVNVSLSCYYIIVYMRLSLHAFIIHSMLWGDKLKQYVSYAALLEPYCLLSAPWFHFSLTPTSMHVFRILSPWPLLCPCLVLHLHYDSLAITLKGTKNLSVTRSLTTTYFTNILYVRRVTGAAVGSTWFSVQAVDSSPHDSTDEATNLSVTVFLALQPHVLCSALCRTTHCNLSPLNYY